MSSRLTRRVAALCVAAMVLATVPPAVAATGEGCRGGGPGNHTVAVRVEPESAALGAQVEAWCVTQHGVRLATAHVGLDATGQPETVQLPVGGARLVDVRVSLRDGLGTAQRRVAATGRVSVLEAEAVGDDWTVLVDDGTARAAVTVAENAGDVVTAAADRLVDYVRRATGVTLRRGEPAADEVEIQLGGTPAGVDALDDDGFVIEVSPDRVDIAGPTAWGTSFGVDEFLERYAGVVWLMPGEGGDDVPGVDTLAVPQERHVEEPVAFSRSLSGITASPIAARRVWGERNGAHQRVSFIHNLHNVLPPDDYFDENPDWYPGRKLPTADNTWQPCFTEDGTVEAAVAEISRYLDDHPEETTYSLGVNDTADAGYCEADPEHPEYPGVMNSIGSVHMSEIYFDWVNQVIEAVLVEHPDIWFGMLAYRNTYDPPEFPVHPRAVVFLTDDRMAWAHPVEEAEGKARTEGWTAVSDNVAFYDYLYGATYGVPRTYPHRMAQTYRYAADQGVVAHHAENYPGFGEGPKTWLSLRLQWDPYADVDDLLDEWYERAVGPAAAPHLAAYYAHWEEFWTGRILQSDWFAERLRPTHADYLRHTSRRYLEPVTVEDLADSRQLLEDVVRLAQTKDQKTRATLLLRSFEYYEAAGRAFGKGAETGAIPASESDALALLAAAEQRFTAHDRLFDLVEEFADDPMLAHPGDPAVYFGTPPGVSSTTIVGNGQHTATVAVAGLAAWLSQDEGQDGATWQRVRELASSASGTPLRSYARLVAATAGGDEPPLVNPGFEDGLAPWSTSLAAPGAGSFVVTSSAAHSGASGIRATGVTNGAISQVVPVSAGTYGAVGHFRVPAGATAGVLEFRLQLRRANGTVLRTLNGPAHQVTRFAGQWASVESLFTVPGDVGGVPVTQARLDLVLGGGPAHWGFPAGEYVDVDDVGLHPVG